MEQRFLIDTNILIEYFGNKLSIQSKIFLNNLDEIIVSAITQIEVLGWRNASTLQLRPLYLFMDFATILPIDKNVIEAATALVQNLKLITKNISDFQNIEDLQLFTI